MGIFCRDNQARSYTGPGVAVAPKQFSRLFFPKQITAALLSVQ